MIVIEMMISNETMVDNESERNQKSLSGVPVESFQRFRSHESHIIKIVGI